MCSLRPFEIQIHKVECTQGGPKLGIQYIVHILLYTYFWPTLYITVKLKNIRHMSKKNANKILMNNFIFEFSTVYGINEIK